MLIVKNELFFVFINKNEKYELKSIYHIISIRFSNCIL